MPKTVSVAKRTPLHYGLPQTIVEGSIADPSHLAYIGRTPGTPKVTRDSDSWYTPIRYLDAIKSALGGKVDLDPYTSTSANDRVEATYIYTQENPAPAGSDWVKCSTCFMNPPYSGKAVLQAVDNFILAYKERRFSSGIVLVNNATETRFFNRLLADAIAVCFTNHRISFENVDGKRVSGNTRGQAFFYFGKKSSVVRFANAFSEIGNTMVCGSGLINKGKS